MKFDPAVLSLDRECAEELEAYVAVLDLADSILDVRHAFFQARMNHVSQRTYSYRVGGANTQQMSRDSTEFRPIVAFLHVFTANNLALVLATINRADVPGYVFSTQRPPASTSRRTFDSNLHPLRLSRQLNRVDPYRPWHIHRVVFSSTGSALRRPLNLTRVELFYPTDILTIPDGGSQIEDCTCCFEPTKSARSNTDAPARTLGRGKYA